jgi:hypothetical protein
VSVRLETGKEWGGVRVPHDEGVANHIGPESCAGTREGVGEALTGDCIDRAIERENDLISGADTCDTVGRQYGGTSARVPVRPDAVADLGMCGPHGWPTEALRVLLWSVSGRRGAVADDARP